MAHDVKTYDVVVIGSGSGAMIVDAALRQGLRVAMVDRGPLGGTCSNVGCIPSKMLIVPADRVMEIREAEKLGIKASVDEIDFPGIMQRMRALRASGQRAMREGLARASNLDFYEQEGFFVDERTLQVGDQQIRGDKVFIVAGTRPLVPPVQGLDQIPYLDNGSVFELDERPDSIAFIGGGYIACELAHFFSAMGSDVIILGRNERLVPEEEPEIAELLQQKMSERMQVHTSTEVLEVRRNGQGYVLIGRDRRSGQLHQFEAEQVVVATGRQSNADRLQVENAGIATDGRGFIQVDEFLETSVPNVWALGDVIGKPLFKHVANREAVLAWHNSQHEEKVPVDYDAVPHAIFTYPEIASVGLREAEARQTGDILVGRARYSDVARGIALMEEDGFAKVIVDGRDRRLLGFHIVGSQASILIQEVINAMATGGSAATLSLGMHIHPALTELVLAAMGNLKPSE